MPTILTTGRTWVVLDNGYFLKFITSGTGGSTSAATDTGTNNGNTGAATGNTGSTAITIKQMPAHTHSLSNGFVNATGNGTAINTKSGVDYGTAYYGAINTGSNGSGEGHTHTLNSHTHTLNNHKHSPGTPASINVYGWKRTA